MVRIALTGGIACGKSLVGKYFSAQGIPVLDADHVARELMRPGTAVFDAVVKAFGAEILGSDGCIDRGRLGAMVFSSDDRRAALDAIVHPEVRRECSRWLDSRDSPGTDGPRASVVIVPLLHEADMAGGWDAVVCVVASEETQLARLRERGLDEDAARRRMRAQAPVSVKADLSDYVILNEGSEATLKEQTMRVLNRILETEHGCS